MEFKYWEDMSRAEAGIAVEIDAPVPETENELCQETESENMSPVSPEEIEISINEEEKIKKHSEWTTKRILSLVLLKIPFIFPLTVAGLVLTSALIAIAFLISIGFVVLGAGSVFLGACVIFSAFSIAGLTSAIVFACGCGLILIACGLLIGLLACYIGFKLIPQIATLFGKLCKLFKLV